MPPDMRKANLRYYSSKGKRIYSDFSTFAQGRALAKCNAIEFARDFSKNKERVVACEYGIGKGDFAKGFLDGVKRLDRKLYLRTRYYLFDFSDKMIADARKSLSSHAEVCIFGKFDAVKDAPFLRFDYCRINELLTDLPARICSLENGAVAGLDGTEPAGAAAFATPFLARVEEGRKLPFNFAAAEFLSKLCALGKGGFRLDVLDYGFYSSDDVFELPVEEWNRLMQRKYGSQITTDLNFPFLLAYLSLLGISAKVGGQKAYAEGILGFKLELSEGKEGLDYVKQSRKNEGIAEDDGFYHLRIGR